MLLLLAYCCPYSKAVVLDPECCQFVDSAAVEIADWDVAIVVLAVAEHLWLFVAAGAKEEVASFEVQVIVVGVAMVTVAASYWQRCRRYRQCFVAVDVVMVTYVVIDDAFEFVAFVAEAVAVAADVAVVDVVFDAAVAVVVVSSYAGRQRNKV